MRPVSLVALWDECRFFGAEQQPSLQQYRAQQSRFEKAHLDQWRGIRYDVWNDYFTVTKHQHYWHIALEEKQWASALTPNQTLIAIMAKHGYLADDVFSEDMFSPGCLLSMIIADQRIKVTMGAKLSVIKESKLIRRLLKTYDRDEMSVKDLGIYGQLVDHLTLLKDYMIGKNCWRVCD